MKKTAPENSFKNPLARRNRQRNMVGYHSRFQSIEDLPPRGTKRWVVRRKAEVISGVRNGILTLEEACERYNLSVEEFLSWQSLIDHHGIQGLRTTRLQKYRGRNL